MVRNRMVAAALALLVCTAAVGAVYEAQWRKVREAEGKDLPRTALEALAPIERDALNARDYPQALRALAERIALEAEIQGDKPEERILRLQREIPKAPEPMRPVLEAILGHAYWQYFQQNRWRFLQRSTTAAAPGKDFTTWDLPRIYAEIDSHFRSALRPRALLRKIPVLDYDALLRQGSAPAPCGPTLYASIHF